MDIGKISVSVTLDEMNNIKTLMDRDKEMAIVRVVSSYMKDGEVQEYSYDKCPCCDEIVVGGYKFCPKCGQRLDMENIAF